MYYVTFLASLPPLGDVSYHFFNKHSPFLSLRYVINERPIKKKFKSSSYSFVIDFFPVNLLNGAVVNKEFIMNYKDPIVDE